MADKTIGLGPGFTAGEDVDLVIETMRGHDLGRILSKGCALPNTGVPGRIGGFDKERVIHSPAQGIRVWNGSESGTGWKRGSRSHHCYRTGGGDGGGIADRSGKRLDRRRISGDKGL